jgi:hypothetical protein
MLSHLQALLHKIQILSQYLKYQEIQGWGQSPCLEQSQHDTIRKAQFITIQILS